MFYYGIQSNSDTSWAFSHIFIIIGLFFTSISLDFRKIPFPSFSLVAINLSIFFGSSLFVFLSVAQYHSWSFGIANILVKERAVPTIWNSLEAINGPSLDIYSYLGLSTIGILIILLLKLVDYFDKSKRFIFTFTIVSFFSVLMAAYSSIALGARTPFVVLLLSIFVTCVFITFFNSDSKTKKSITLYSLGLFIFFIVICIFTYYALMENLIGLLDNMVENGIGNRFADEGLETDRYQIWLEVLSQMIDLPWGGKVMIISGSYAHNIWLDQIYEAGIFSGLFLLTFHLSQILIIFKFLQLKLPKMIHVFGLCSTLAFFTAFLQAPVMQASTLYFGVSCFFFGSLSRFTSDCKYDHKLLKCSL
ncbi:MAG: hypothetical protein LH649_18185 [Pseudanabaena sp. CAN_BIN31]|nr:hypothetical protein [Pseudanabaena sp. CAN_BIN31]